MYEYEYIPNKNSILYEKTIDEMESLRAKNHAKKTADLILKSAKEDIYNTVSIEGNKMKKEEVKYVLANDVTIRGRSLRDHLQVRNCNNMLPILEKIILQKDFVLDEDAIKTIHYIVTKDELPVTESGQYRTEPVHVRYTDYIPPTEDLLPELINELCRNYYRELGVQTQFERICEFKRNFERIHPFIDGNGRTGRFLFNILLLSNGYGYFSVPAHERDLYFTSLENNTFHEYAAKTVLQNMKQKIKRGALHDRIR